MKSSTKCYRCGKYFKEGEAVLACIGRPLSGGNIVEAIHRYKFLCWKLNNKDKQYE